MSARVEIEVGAGELIDRLTILRVKQRRLRDPVKRRSVAEALETLAPAREALGDTTRLPPLEVALGVVNDRLWTVEDQIRSLERRSDFGPSFVELARSIYRLNDLRHSLKCEIDSLFGEARSEVKEYAQHEPSPARARPVRGPILEEESCPASS